MLLVIDVGNTNTVVGAMVAGKVIHRWRITTKPRTTDEMGLLFLELFRLEGLAFTNFTGVCVSCVVPSVLFAIDKASRHYLKQDPLVISRGIKTGLKICTDDPRQIGSDRIVNSVAAYRRYKKALVVVDFGTATTLDCINSKGDYLGGSIAPGFKISIDALFTKTAKLPKVEVERTESVIGKNTVHSMQAGMFWGYVGLVDELARRCKAELQEMEPTKEVVCIATGGLAHLIGEACKEIQSIERDLTLQGLWDLYHLNQK